MPGHMIAYNCTCGFEGMTTPGVPALPPCDLRVSAFDPEENKIATIKEKEALERELYIYVDPFAATFTRHHPFGEVFDEDPETGARFMCPICRKGTLEFQLVGHWD